MSYLEKLAKQQLSQLNGSTRQNVADKYVQMPQGKTGIITLRILPSAEEDTEPWVTTRLHRNIKAPGDPGKGYTVHCPREQGADGYWRGKCAICDFYQSLYKAADAASTEEESEQFKEFARDIKPRLRVYYNAIIRKWTNPKTGDIEENVGPRILSNGEKLHYKVLTAITGDEQTETVGLGDITAFASGSDLKIIKKTNGGFANYDESLFLAASPAGSKAEVKEWMSNLWDLKELRRIETEEKLQYYADILQGKTEDLGFDGASKSKPVSVAVPAAVAPAAVAPPTPVVEEAPFEAAPASTTDDFSVDDIDMSIVGEDFLDDIDKILEN
jgi:hypothetical protein